MSASGFRGACIAALLALTTPLPRAEAQTTTTVAVVGPAGDRLTTRLRAELRGLGLLVTAVDEESDRAAPQDLQTLARETGAAVTIRASQCADGGVELWMVDRVTGKMLLREVLERDLSDEDSDAVVALRAVELLRASLLELDLEHPGRGEVEPTPELRRAAGLAPDRTAVPGNAKPITKPSTTNAEQPPRAPADGDSFFAEAGLAINAHLSETRAATAIGLGAWWQPSERAGVGAWGVLPLSAEEIARAEGTAGVRSSAFGAALRFTLTSPRSRWSPALGAGAAVLLLRAEGTQGSSNLVSSSARVLTAGPSAEASLGFRVLDSLAVRTELRSVVTFPRPVVHFAGQEVAVLGRPFVTWALGLEYRAVPHDHRD